MRKIKINNMKTSYPATLMEISDTKLAIDFVTGIPNVSNFSKIDVIDEQEETEKTYESFDTVYFRYGTRVILSNNGTKIPKETLTNQNTVEMLTIIKEEKLKEISETCQQVIRYGIDVGDAHYSLTENDQTNLFGKQAQLAAGAEQVEYHADGEPCRYFTAEEMAEIITMAMTYVTYHTTYCNALNMWIKAASTVEELHNIYYGCTIPEEYQSVVLKNIISQEGNADEAGA